MVQNNEIQLSSAYYCIILSIYKSLCFQSFPLFFFFGSQLVLLVFLNVILLGNWSLSISRSAVASLPSLSVPSIVLGSSFWRWGQITEILRCVFLNTLGNLAPVLLNSPAVVCMMGGRAISVLLCQNALFFPSFVMERGFGCSLTQGNKFTYRYTASSVS